jgi:hypothetical protein
VEVTNGRTKGWVPVTPKKPCPVCGKLKWCSVSADGLRIHCRHESAGAIQTKMDKAGAPYYVHLRNGGNGHPASGHANTPKVSGREAKRADTDTLNAVYTALLATLSLNEVHRENLRQRGLSDAEIERRGYRTLAKMGRAGRAAGLRNQFGDKVLSVPGFVIREKNGRQYLTLAGASGLLIPVRDLAGRIVALRVRRDEKTEGGKYLWISSKKGGGPGPGSPVHVPLEINGPVELARLTEGELKADLATVLSRLPTLGTPGAGIWKPALEVLRKLGCKTVRLAFDADSRTKPDIARALLACASDLEKKRFAIELERWPAQHKGIDDALAAGITPEVLKEEQVGEELASIAAKSKIDRPPEADRADTEKKGPPPATRLIGYALNQLELWHSTGAEPYATTRNVPKQTWPLRSRHAKHYLAMLFYVAERTGVSAEVMQTALNTLQGQALFAGQELPVFVRLAEDNGHIFLDLGGSDWQAVVLTPAGWQVTADYSIRFRRSRGALAIPVPVPGGDLEELRRFINIDDDGDWRLLVGWLLAALRPKGPYPVLCLHGEQGSAKSTTARALRSLVDPNSAPLRSEPRDARDLIIAATNSWVVALDNLSHLQPWLSDALCRLATGGGFGTRELYTDADEVLFDAMRPCLLTGIEELATRGDLLERSLILHLPAIAEEERQTEAAFWRAFEEARPRILGALLDAVAVGLRELPNVKLPRLPRMADLAAWVSACEPALGWQPGAFLSSYTANVAQANELALESSPIAEPLRSYVDQHDTWEGTASDLLAELTKLAGEKAANGKEWPKKPHVLSGKLKRLAPNLRKVGIDVAFDRQAGGKRTRIIRLGKGSAKERPEASQAPHSHTSQAVDGQAAGGAGTHRGRLRDAPSSETSHNGTLRDAGDAPSGVLASPSNAEDDSREPGEEG